MFSNLLDLVTKINSDEEAIAYFIKMRWNGKVVCPFKKCDSNIWNEQSKIYNYANKKEFKCSCCKHRFSYKTGTFLENSKVSMRKWLMAMYIFTSHKKGISSIQLGKDIGVRQATAWFMLQRLRAASNKNFNGEQYDGISEIDETYYGGKAENMHMSKRIAAKGIYEKAVVLGIINRDTKQVKLVHTEDAKYHTLAKEVMNKVVEGSTIIADESSAYYTLGKMGYVHEKVNHSKGEYVKKEKSDARTAFKITTNSIEGVFGLLKRGINGTYHWVSKKHLQKYLSEFTFRFNTRDFEAEGSRLDYFMSNLTGRLKYSDLIA